VVLRRVPPQYRTRVPRNARRVLSFRPRHSDVFLRRQDARSHRATRCRSPTAQAPAGVPTAAGASAACGAHRRPATRRGEGRARQGRDPRRLQRRRAARRHPASTQGHRDRARDTGKWMTSDRTGRPSCSLDAYRPLLPDRPPYVGRNLALRIPSSIANPLIFRLRHN